MNDWAFRNQAARALGSHLLQRRPHPLQVDYLPVHIGKMRDDSSVHVRTGIGAAIDKLEQFPNFAKCETQFATPLDERQSSGLLIRIYPVT